MDRCIGCSKSDRAGEILAGDFWCHQCVVDGQFAAFVEAQLVVESVLAERARRVPTPRDENRFKPAETG